MCPALPKGDVVPVRLELDGQPYSTTTLTLSAYFGYIFSLEPDENGQATFDSAVMEPAGCSMSQCTEYWYYTSEACAAGDPCEWIQDGYCDDSCEDLAEYPLDDSIDCSGLGAITCDCYCECSSCSFDQYCEEACPKTCDVLCGEACVSDGCGSAISALGSCG